VTEAIAHALAPRKPQLTILAAALKFEFLKLFSNFGSKNLEEPFS